MKRITIIGMGMGADTVTQEGMRAIGEAEVLIGAPRLLDAFDQPGKQRCAEYAPKKVAQAVESSESERFAVLVSGDTGFYSAAEKLCAALSVYGVTLMPGVSSLNCFFARLKRPWQKAALISCHGREENLADTVRRNCLTFVLAGDNIPLLGEALTEAGFGHLCVYVGENLGMKNERVISLRADGLADADFGALAVLLIENPAADSRVRCGLPDELFLRGDVPMTKAEVRAVTASKLALRPGAICCDVGCGTGSVTVEMALAAYDGRVYAIDKSAEAVRLTRENCRAFHIGNVKTILGGAPEALAGLPPMDAAFIGGSGGKLTETVAVLLGKNAKARVVVNAVTLESVQQAKAAFWQKGIEPGLVQIGVVRTKTAGSRRLMAAQNPVFILWGGGNG